MTIFNKAFRISVIVISVIAIIAAVVVALIGNSYPNNPSSMLFAYRIKSSKKVVMLTFDDGPLEFNAKKEDPATPDRSDFDPKADKNYYTIDDEILDILSKESKKYNEPIPGTFFEVGSHVHKRENDRDPQSKNLTRTMTRIIDSGSWIGSHTYNHDHYAKKPEKYFFKDIEMSYASIDRFYKEYFDSKTIDGAKLDAQVLDDDISNVVINNGKRREIANIPLRLPFLQSLPNSWSNKLIKKMNINEIIYGSWGTDWDETGEENAPESKIEDYFINKKWGDYKSLNNEYSRDSNDSDAKKEFEKRKQQAIVEVSKETILNYYENKLMSKPGSNGQIIVCHTRTFAKHWLPQLIEWLHDRGYQFAGMNPFADNYYKNFGELINRK